MEQTVRAHRARIAQFPLHRTPVEQKNYDKSKKLGPRSDSIGPVEASAQGSRPHQGGWGAPAAADLRAGQLRIVRPGRSSLRAPFQEEWEPADDPEAEDGGPFPPARPEPPPRWLDLAQSVALSASVSAFVTLVLTVRAMGLAPGLAETWLTTLKLSLLIGLPARFLLEPYVARLVGLVALLPRRTSKV